MIGRWLLVAVAIVALTGCAAPPVPTATLAPAPTVAPPKPTVAVAPTPTVAAAPTPPPSAPAGSAPTAAATPVGSQASAATPAKPSASGGNVPSAAANLVAAARAALATRANVADSAITVVSVQEVDWRDASIGCPEPGQMYAQVITEGYRIILQASGTNYEYHSDARRVVYCQNPSQ